MRNVYFPKQIQAIKLAIGYITQLPRHFRWSLWSSEESEDTVLNIFIRPEDDLQTVAHQLDLENPIEDNLEFNSYQQGPLLVSLDFQEDE